MYKINQTMQPNYSVLIVRHEQRYDYSNDQCSLTIGGIVNAHTKTIDKINKTGVEINNVYSSPFLRTIQTIIPYCVENNKKPKLEDALYEHMSYAITHYYLTNNRNKILNQYTQANPPIPYLYPIFKLWCMGQYESVSYMVDESISQIKRVSDERLTPLLKILVKLQDELWYISTANDYETIKDLKKSEELKNGSDTLKDRNDNSNRILNCLHNYIHKPNEFWEDIESRKHKIDKIFFGNLMNHKIDTDYVPLLNIDDYHDPGKIYETHNDVVKRTDVLADNIIENKRYQDSIYVSHQGVIEKILYSLIKKYNLRIGKDNPFKGYESFEKHFFDNYKLEMGDIIRVDFYDHDIKMSLA